MHAFHFVDKIERLFLSCRNAGSVGVGGETHFFDLDFFSMHAWLRQGGLVQQDHRVPHACMGD